jgi:hypothetical protein
VALPERRGPLASPSVGEGRQRQPPSGSGAREAPREREGGNADGRTEELDPHHLNFVQREGRSEKLVAEVELVFGEYAGILSGMKLVGLRIWKSEEGRLFVTLPARAGKGGALLRVPAPGHGRQHDREGLQGGRPASVEGEPSTPAPFGVNGRMIKEWSARLRASILRWRASDSSNRLQQRCSGGRITFVKRRRANTS